MTPALIIFDCDGVLIDSEAISYQVLTDELALEGIVIDLGAFRRHFLGRSFPVVETEVSRVWSHQLPPEFQSRYLTRLLARFEHQLAAMAGVAEVLADLSVPFCLATSSSPERLRRSLAVTGLAPFFADRIFTAAEVKHGKPAPDLFLYAARRMGIPPADVAVLEDSEPGLVAAVNAGMTVWQFTGGGHMAGEPPSPRAERHFSSFAAFRSGLPQLFRTVSV